MELRGYNVKQQERVPIMFKGVDLAQGLDDAHALRFDLLVEDKVVVELKSVEELKKVYFKQLRTYLHFLRKPIGLLFNFNVDNLMHDGFGRVVEGYDWKK